MAALTAVKKKKKFLATFKHRFSTRLYIDWKERRKKKTAVTVFYFIPIDSARDAASLGLPVGVCVSARRLAQPHRIAVFYQTMTVRGGELPACQVCPSAPWGNGPSNGEVVKHFLAQCVQALRGQPDFRVGCTNRLVS